MRVAAVTTAFISLSRYSPQLRKNYGGRLRSPPWMAGGVSWLAMAEVRRPPTYFIARVVSGQSRAGARGEPVPAALIVVDDRKRIAFRIIHKVGGIGECLPHHPPELPSMDRSDRPRCRWGVASPSMSANRCWWTGHNLRCGPFTSGCKLVLFSVIGAMP